MSPVIIDGRIRTSAGRYYHVTEKTGTNGEYLHKKEQLSLIRQLAQKDYDKQFLKAAKAELKFMKHGFKSTSRIKQKTYITICLPKGKSWYHHTFCRTI